MVAAAAAILIHALIENRKQGLMLLGLYAGLGVLGLEYCLRSVAAWRGRI